MKPCLTFFLTTFLAHAALAADDTYDSSPGFKAGDILQPVWLTGPHHLVREEVKTYNGLNHFVIDSPFGTFVAHGNLMLQSRVVEILALARLREMSSSEEYVQALKRASKAPFEVVGDIVQAPGETIATVPKGVGKFLGRMGRGVKEVAGGRERGQGEDGLIKSVAGVSRTKRELSARLTVNPYSSNEILQEEMDRVAWAAFAGDMTFTAATLPISGAAGAALSALSTVELTSSLVYEQSPLDLRKTNLSRLQAMNVPPEAAEAFLSNTSFSPWHQTRLVGALQQLAGVDGRNLYVLDAARTSNSEADAVFYEQTARLIAHAHTHGIAVSRLIEMDGFPVCLTADGGFMVALHWDYAMWSPGSERFANALQSVQVEGAKPPTITVVLTGVMSPRLRQELEGRGFKVQDRLLPGPLK
jgi:hypothetical protein